MIYTHAHVDHFGGVHGVYEADVPDRGRHGFMASAVIGERLRRARP